MLYMLIIQWQCSQCGENTVYSLRLLRHLAAVPRMKRDYVSRVRTGQCQCRRCAQPGEVVKWWHFLLFRQSMQSIHGIMGSPEPNWISQVRPHPDCKSVWLAAVSPCRAPIGRLSPLHCLFISPSCWGTHFLYLSNPPSGNLLPIIPWVECSIMQLSGQLLASSSIIISQIFSQDQAKVII